MSKSEEKRTKVPGLPPKDRSRSRVRRADGYKRLDEEQKIDDGTRAATSSDSGGSRNKSKIQKAFGRAVSVGRGLVERSENRAAARAQSPVHHRPRSVSYGAKFEGQEKQEQAWQEFSRKRKEKQEARKAVAEFRVPKTSAGPQSTDEFEKDLINFD